MFVASIVNKVSQKIVIDVDKWPAGQFPKLGIERIGPIPGLDYLEEVY